MRLTSRTGPVGAQRARQRRAPRPRRRQATHALVAHEILDDDAKVDTLRAYLRRWKAEVGVFFDGVGPDSSDDELRRIAPRHPVFELTPA